MFKNIGHGLEQLGLQADAIGEQQLSGRKLQAAAGAGSSLQIDAVGDHQLKWTQSGSSSSAQRAVRCQITHIGERGGSS